MRARSALLLLGSALCLGAKPFPKPPSNYVHNEGVVSPGVERTLSSELAAFESATGYQFVVALFQGLDGESLEDWTNRLFREWRIGDAQRNGGLLFALYRKDRKWRVEVGYGFEGRLTDLEAAETVRARARPLFKRGDYDAGVLAGVRDLEAKFGYPQAQSPPAAPPIGSKPWTDSWSVFLVAVALLLVFVWVLVGGLLEMSSATLGRRGSNPASSSGLKLRLFFDVLQILFAVLAGGRSGGGSGGGFSGGGGSSGGGGASGDW